MTGLRELTKSEWESLRALVHDVTGIALSPHKKVLLISRLGKRLDALGFATFKQYYQHLMARDPAGTELQAFVNAITTNKTEFYREPEHFNVLTAWLQSKEPAVVRARSRGLRIWCAASSSGEEPYTLADVLRSTLSRYEWNATEIFATDLDTKVLAKAQRAIYEAESLADLPDAIRRRVFLRGTGLQRGHYRVRSELRNHVHFSQLNLIKRGWLIRGPIDVIFCRNVLIYFDKATQLDVVRRMCSLLEPHGLLFLGHSEGLAGIELGLEAIAHTAYRACGQTSTHTSVSLPRLRAVAQPSLRIGEKSTIESPASWSRAVFDSGILVVLTAGSRNEVRSCRLISEGDDQANAFQFAQLAKAAARSEGSRGKNRMAAKIVVIHRQSSAEKHSKLLDVLRNRLACMGIEIVAMRFLEGPAEVRVDCATGRLLTRSSMTRPSKRSRTQRSPSVQHSSIPSPP